MPFFAGMNNDLTLFFCVAAMLVESYIAISYVNNKNYQHNDNRRIIVGVLALLTVLFCVTQYNVFNSGTNAEKLLLIFSFVGSLIVCSYTLGNNSDSYSTDWRRKFIEIYYYIMVGLVIATALGVKDANTAVKIQERGATKVVTSLGNATDSLLKSVSNSTGDVVTGVSNVASSALNTVENVGQDLLKGVKDITTESVNTVGKVGSNLASGVGNVGSDLSGAISK